MKRNILLAFLMLAVVTKSIHAATMKNDPAAEKMWKALNLMAVYEELPLHIIDGDSDILKVRSLTCASEQYDACSFFVRIKDKEKLIVHTAVAGIIIDALYANGIYPSEDSPSLTQWASSVSCSRTNGNYTCVIKE